jgi:3-phenylpropionate/cinnamic acid dioxygenase small subunit
MAENGVWMRQGTALEGPQAVKAALEKRDPARHTAHVVTNLWVEHATENTARVRFYMTAFETRTDAPAPQMLGVRDSTDELVLENGQWRIARKDSRRILPPEA